MTAITTTIFIIQLTWRSLPKGVVTFLYQIRNCKLQFFLQSNIECQTKQKAEKTSKYAERVGGRL